MKQPDAGWSMKNILGDGQPTDIQISTPSQRYTEMTKQFRKGANMKGSMHILQLSHMEIATIDIESNTDVVIHQQDAVERCVSTFVTKGHICSAIYDHQAKLEQQGGNHSLLHIKSEDSKHRIRAGSTSLVYINLNPASLHTFFPDWHQHTRSIYRRQANNSYCISPAFSLRRRHRLQHAIDDLVNPSFTGATRNLFVEAKATELLALQLEDVIQHSSAKQPVSLLNKADTEKLNAVREFIDEHYLAPLSLEGLARQFLLNEFKLKKGFQELFHQSTFNYIHLLRMERAKELLHSGEMTVSEVSDELGYSSYHNFSNAFFKHFGYRPSMVCK